MQTVRYKPCAIGCSLMYKASDNATSTECDLVLRTHFPDPPYVDLDRRSWKQPNRSTVYEVPDLELAQNYDARLSHGVLCSALAAVLLLRNYHRIRRLANTMLRGSALDKNRTMNRGRGSYHAEDVSGTIAVSQMTTGSEMAPTENFRSRGLKKHRIIPQGGRIIQEGGRAVETGNVNDIGSTRSERALARAIYSRTLNNHLIICEDWRATEVANITNVVSTSSERARRRPLKEHPIIHKG